MTVAPPRVTLAPLPTGRRLNVEARTFTNFTGARCGRGHLEGFSDGKFKDLVARQDWAPESIELWEWHIDLTTKGRQFENTSSVGFAIKADPEEDSQRVQVFHRRNAVTYEGREFWVWWDPERRAAAARPVDRPMHL